MSYTTAENKHSLFMILIQANTSFQSWYISFKYFWPAILTISELPIFSIVMAKVPFLVPQLRFYLVALFLMYTSQDVN